MVIGVLHSVAYCIDYCIEYNTRSIATLIPVTVVTISFTYVP